MPAAQPALTAPDVVAAVRRHYGAEKDGLGPEWAALDEFSLGTGAGRQRADLFLVRAWSGRPKGHERHAIEVKVSRADLCAELAKPWKALAFTEVSHRFYLAVPKGLLRPGDAIPDHWGVYEVSGHPAATRCRKAREATRRDPEPMPETALAEAFRRAARAEARIREADTDTAEDPAATLALMRAELAAANRAAQTAREASRRDKDRLSALLAKIGEAGGWHCVCGAPIKVDRYRVLHADKSHCARGSAQLDPGSADVLAARLGLPDPLDEPALFAVR